MFNTTVAELKRLNNLTSNTLLIGQQLKVPVSNQPNGEILDGTYYEVAKGDSLWSIARKYGITVDDLIKLNNLTTINLQVGDKLKVPPTTSQKTYVVKSGDSLWSIAKANNTSVDELKQVNNLTSNLLTIGQVLVIPN